MSGARLSTSEQEYLCGILRSIVTDEPAPAPPAVIEWERFHRALAVSRLIPFFYPHAKDAGAPDAYAEYWQRYTLAILRKHRSDMRAAVEVCDLLEEAGVPAVCMRGLGLAHRAYPDPMLRPMSDLDVLVTRADADRMIGAFAARNIPHKTSHNQLVCNVGGCKIEVHWHLVKRLFAFSLDFDELVASREVLESDQGRIFVLPLEHELIGVICHGVIHHDMDTLLKALDIALLCRRSELDWQALEAWARRSSLTSMFEFSFDLVDHLMATDYRSRFPGAGSAAGSKRSFAPYTSRLFGLDTRRSWFGRFFAALAMADTRADRARMLARFGRLKTLAHLARRPFDTREPAAVAGVAALEAKRTGSGDRVRSE